MTVSTTTNSVVYRGNGAATSFGFAFKVIDEDDLVVQRRIYATGVVDKTYVASEYTVSGIGSDAGVVTLPAALANTYEIVISRVVPYTQELDIVNQGGFYPETVEQQLDYLTMGLQQLSDTVSRTLRAKPGLEGLEALRTANTVFGTNSSGELVQLTSDSFRGDPGGNVESVGLWDNFGIATIDSGTDAIRTSGYSRDGWGLGTYVSDILATEELAAAHPRFCKADAGGRYFRLLADDGIASNQCGAVGDNVTDDGPAFADGIAYLKDLAANDQVYYKGSAPLRVVFGNYYLGTTTLDISHTLGLLGSGSGFQGGISTKLRWAAGTTGIRLQRFNTSGVDTIDGPHYGSDGTAVRGLAFFGVQALTSTGVAEGEHHAIHMKARGLIEDCYILGWQGDGIHIVATAGFSDPTEGNANCFEINRCAILYCRDGIHVDGADANAGRISLVDASYNRRWGINDSSFLGNTYVGCHADANGLIPNTTATLVHYSGKIYAVIDGQDTGASTNAPSGTTADNTWWYYMRAGVERSDLNIPTWTTGMAIRAGGAYRTNDASNANGFLVCYSEGAQGPSQFAGATLFVGGLHGAGVKGTGAFVYGRQGSLQGRFSSVDADGYGQFLNEMRLQFYHATKGDFSLEWSGNDLVATFNASGLPSNQPFQITGDLTTSPLGSRRLNFSNGYGMNGKKRLSGTAAPASGTYAVGDTVENEAPVAGGFIGWVCTTAGSPGTWKGYGAIEA